MKSMLIMKVQDVFSHLILFIAIFAYCGIAPAQQTTDPAGFGRAKRALASAVRDYPCPHFAVSGVSLTYDALQLSGRALLGEKPHANTWSWHNGQLTIRLLDIKSVEQRSDYFDCQQAEDTAGLLIETESHQPARFIDLQFSSSTGASEFKNALNWLVAHAAQLPADAAAEQLAFDQKIAGWKASASKPPMPDEAHTHEVLAKHAVEEKNFDKAIYEYEAALEIFPTWPDGQFNVALICGETADYDCAVEHMQDYLELVPNAPDAQAAKDKLIVWKDKLDQSQAEAAPTE
jgi:tetratricopeptide (TPR) repeat protein